MKLDVRQHCGIVSEIQWCRNTNKNLTPTLSVGSGICMPKVTITSKQNLENLITALRKAADLGWVK